jgi:dTDP-4-dehydrorhamnose reductase
MLLLLGATGYVGQAFSQELSRRRWPFIPLTRKSVNYASFDVLFDYVRKTKPEFVINAAGFAPHPDMEISGWAREEALRANVLLPQTIAQVCHMTKTPWGHVSSGSIYTGARVETKPGHIGIERDLHRRDILQLFAKHPEKIHGFTERDEPNFSFHHAPCDFYSGTKALAEDAIREKGRCYIWRPGILFDESEGHRNMLCRLPSGKPLYNTINSVTQLNDFVSACLEMWEHRAGYGIYNVVNIGAVTTHRIAELIRQILKPGWKFRFRKNDEAFGPYSVKNPGANCILDVSKLLATGIKMRSAEEALKDTLQKQHTVPSLLEYNFPVPAPISVPRGVNVFEQLFARQT